MQNTVLGYTKLCSILGIAGELEKNQIKERQLEGIQLAKLKDVYKGRKNGTMEDPHQFFFQTEEPEAVAVLDAGAESQGSSTGRMCAPQ